MPRSDATRQLERSIGALSQAAIAGLDAEFPWFRALNAEDRSWIGVIASRGIASFVEWLSDPDADPRVGAAVFAAAPRELTGAITLQQTVEMVRATIDMVERRVDDVVAAEDAPMVREALLRYSREVAFAAAEVYASAAEQRGRWDARLEALVVDAVLRGEADEAARSRATALGWASTSDVCVVLGHTPDGDSAAAVDAIKRSARGRGVDALCAVQGERLVVVLGGVGDAGADTAAIAGHFGAGAVVAGPVVDDLLVGGVSARAAIAGFRAAAAWPGRPRPVFSEDLLPERALNGDGHARRQLVSRVYQPLVDAGSGLADTLAAYLDASGSVEGAARVLFVHPNTVRYRLRRIADVTGFAPGDARDAYTLHLAVTLGRLHAAQNR